MSSLKYRQMLQRYTKDRQRNILASPGPNSFTIVLDNLKAGYNVAKIFRTAEAFGASAIHLINIGPFDPAPAKGALRKVPAFFHDEFQSCYDSLAAAGYTLFQLVPGSQAMIHNCELPIRSAFVFGHEEFGHSFRAADYPDIRAISIPQFGSVQSLNVSIAASVVMYEYIRRQDMGFEE